jgi:hypothetical protein
VSFFFIFGVWNMSICPIFGGWETMRCMDASF